MRRRRRGEGFVPNRYERHNIRPAWMRKRPSQFSLGYQHNLSKRTALYGTYSYLKKSKDGGTMSLVADSGATLSDSGNSMPCKWVCATSF